MAYKKTLSKELRRSKDTSGVGMFAHKTSAITIQHQCCGARKRPSINNQSISVAVATYQAKLVIGQLMTQAKASVVSPFPSVYQYTADTARLCVTRSLRSHCDIQSTRLPLVKRVQWRRCSFGLLQKNSL